MESNRLLAIAVCVVSVILSGGSCDGDVQPRKITLVNEGAENEVTMLAPLNTTTSAAGAYWQTLNNNVTRIEYETGDRLSIFLFDDDLYSGLASHRTIVYLSDLSNPGDKATFQVPLSQRGKIKSVRTYDSGVCSAMIDYSDLARILGQGLVENIAEDPRVDNPRIAWVDVVPRPGVILSNPGNDSGLEMGHERDEIDISFRLETDGIFKNNVGSINVLGCHDVEMTVELTVEVMRFFGHSFVVDSDSLALSKSSGVLWKGMDLRNALEEYPYSWLTAGHYDYPIIDSSPANPMTREEYIVTMPTTFASTGATASGADIFLKVKSISSERDFSARRCINFARAQVRELFNKSLANRLPLAFRDAVRDVLLVDPWFVSGAGAARSCATDADCDFRAPDAPAFSETSHWNGASHQCIHRDATRVRMFDDTGLIEDIIDSLPQGKFCHFKIDADNVNVRPDGVEIPIVYDVDQDPQYDLISSSLLSSTLCDASRSGTPISTGVASTTIAQAGAYVAGPFIPQESP